jgi:type VI secretion system protein ImpC
MPGRLEFDVTLGRSGRPRPEEEPLRFLVLGDFSGRPAVDRAPLAKRPTLQVDFDNLAAVMRKLEPRIAIAGKDLHFREIDDFHPDRLFQRLEEFHELRAKREHPPTERDDSFARLLGSPPKVEEPSAAPRSGLDALLHSIVAPHVVKELPAHAKQYVETVEAAMAEEMRRLLHDPAMQAMESTWRGLHWLISSLELDEQLQVHILDVTREELLTDIVNAGGAVAQTGVYRALVERWRNVPGAQGWSALVSLLQFGSSNVDVGVLAAMGMMPASRSC